MEFRNIVRVDAENIDCEMDHPHFGWIPFTASKNDVEEHGRRIFEALELLLTEMPEPKDSGQ